MSDARTLKLLTPQYSQVIFIDHVLYKARLTNLEADMARQRAAFEAAQTATAGSGS